ncbi:putative Neuropeptides capa receptor [Hypsibius exemplaris]|uniref:Neuropeptides capa receptor n=1 Tax=Hypsibius exemplaris TaxID=2072580 RepID=A0A9X6RMX3_HYPEX|nr:putative Neuropeptides capa receptor [Hypsibius exemplaris]
MDSAVALTSLYSFLLVSGLVGNLATLWSIMRNARVQTPTNCYIISLAASDIFILLLGTPEEIYRFWLQYPWTFGSGFCRFRNMASEMFLFILILTIVAFTAERYMMIVHPLLSRKLMKSRRRIYKVIIIIWIVAVVNALPYAIYSEIGYIPNPVSGQIIPESAHCALPIDTPIVRRYLEYSFVVFFVLPMILLAFHYARIGVAVSRKMDSHSMELNGDRAAASQALSSAKSDLADDGAAGSPRRSARTSVIKMLGGIVLSFFICFSVFHAQRLMTMWVDWTNASDSLKSFYIKLNMISGTLYYLNPSLNPVLYAFHTKKFQRGFRAIFRPCGCKLIQPNFRSSMSTNNRNYPGTVLPPPLVDPTDRDPHSTLPLRSV